MITCVGGTPNTNPTTNDIAAPTELSGIHLVTAKRALSTIILFSPPISLIANSVIKLFVPLLLEVSNEGWLPAR
jgi:hypothetical protein